MLHLAFATLLHAVTMATREPILGVASPYSSLAYREELFFSIFFLKIY
jgi:hypothetical protein